MCDERWSFVRLSRVFRSVVYQKPFVNSSEWLKAAKNAVDRSGAEVVLPVTERSTRLLIEHRAALQDFVFVPPLPSIEILDLVSDKRRLWEFQRAQALSCTPTVFAAGRGSDGFSGDQLEYPCLLKPTRGKNGEGIQAVRNAAELQGWQETHVGDDEEYIAQKYVPGRDVDCSVLCRDGEVVVHTVQHRASADSGATLEVFAGGEALEAVRPLIRALGYSGIAHIDMRQDEAGNFTIIDFNPRFWASLFSSTLAGVNFPELWCRMAFEEQVVQPEIERIFQYSSLATVRYWAKRVMRPGKGKPVFAWRHSSLPSALTDPLPLLAKAAVRLCRAIQNLIAFSLQPRDRQKAAKIRERLALRSA
jgi:predicted ATP-grasp superfamily ATP-dependent carboligase